MLGLKKLFGKGREARAALGKLGKPGPAAGHRLRLLLRRRS